MRYKVGDKVVIKSVAQANALRSRVLTVDDIGKTGKVLEVHDHVAGECFYYVEITNEVGKAVGCFKEEQLTFPKPDMLQRFMNDEIAVKVEVESKAYTELLEEALYPLTRVFPVTWPFEKGKYITRGLDNGKFGYGTHIGGREVVSSSEFIKEVRKIKPLTIKRFEVEYDEIGTNDKFILGFNCQDIANLRPDRAFYFRSTDECGSAVSIKNAKLIVKQLQEMIEIAEQVEK